MIFIVLSLSCEVNAQEPPEIQKFESLEETLSHHSNLADWYIFARCGSHISVLSALGQMDDNRRDKCLSLADKFLVQSVNSYMKQQGLSLENPDLIKSVVDNVSNFTRAVDKLYIQDLSEAQARYAEDALAHSMLGLDNEFCSGLVLALD